METIKDVESIFHFAKTLNTKKDIEKYVERPLIPIVNYLYDLNILTTMTSANTKNWHTNAYVIIDYDTLSTKNKKIADNLLQLYPYNCQKSHFSIEGNNTEFQVNMPIQDHTTFKEIHDFFFDKFKDFEIQEIFSIYDCESRFKNIYSLRDAIVEYLCYTSYTNITRFTKEDKLKTLLKEDFLDDHSIELRFLKELGGENHYNEDKEIYIYKYGIHYTYSFVLKQVLKEHKNKLFNHGKYSVEQANITFLTEFLHNQISKNFFFNESDKRFYLNRKLLDRHSQYVASNESIKTLKKDKHHCSVISS